MKRRAVGIILTVGLVLCMISEVAVASQGGVCVSVTRDKAQYGSQEVAHLTVHVENTMDKPVYQVEIQGHLPDGLQLADESGIFVIDEIPAHASVTRSIDVMKNPEAEEPVVSRGGLCVSVTRDKVQYSPQEVAYLTVRVENTTDKPVYHVEIQGHLPDGLQLAGELGAYVIDEIPAHASVTRTIDVMKCPEEEEPIAPQSGLCVSVTRDKVQYGPQDVAHLTVQVENTTDKPVYHVEIKGHLPEELQFADESDIFVIDEIPAHTSVAQSIDVMKRSDGLLVVVKANKEQYKKNEIAELRVIVTNQTDKPVQNVRIEHFLPGGLQYVDHSGAYLSERSALGPGESIDYAVRVKIMDPLPETGDKSYVQMIVCIAAMLTASVLLVKLRKGEEIK